MKVVVARTAGFCRGVRDALNMTLDAIKSLQDGENICTFGPLIHNRQVLSMLEEKGIREELNIESCAGKKVVIRAHGIPPYQRHALHRAGAALLDATCKRVARVQAVIKWHARKGFHTVIVGDLDHAEVIGLMGYTENGGRVINRAEQVEELPQDWENVLLVAQTTQNEEVFQAIHQKFLERYPNATVKNTICGSTHERQAEVRQLCAQVEAMVIVGGHHSGNTVRLAEVARECDIPTYHVETEAELDAQEMAQYHCVGVSAGASTPTWMIRNVVRFLESVQPEYADARFTIRRLFELLAYTNVNVALGAALLTFAVRALTGFIGSFIEGVMAGLYVFAMHTLNIYLDRDAMQLNDPGRAAFYQRRRKAFTGIAVASVLVSLCIAFEIGLFTLFAMTMLVLLGILYAVPLFLPSWRQGFSEPKIKDIPASKTLSVPIAWASATVLVPHLSSFTNSFPTLAYGFWIFFLLVLVRTALLDLLAVQGDRLVGKETVVVLLGESKAPRFVIGILVLLLGSLLIGPLSGLSSAFAYLMLPAALMYMWCLRVCLQSRLKEDPILETFIESVLIITGAAGALWAFFYH